MALNGQFRTRNVVKIDRLLIVEMAVTAEFKGAEGCSITNLVCYYMVEGAIKGVGGLPFDLPDGTAEKAGCTLCVNIRSFMERPVHTCYEVNLTLDLFKRFQSRCQRQVVYAW